MELRKTFRYGIPIDSLEMLRQVYAFDAEAYREGGTEAGNIPWSLFVEWWRSFPSGFLCTYDGNVPVAVVGLFPVTADWSERFLAHQTSEHELDAACIEAAVGEARDTAHSCWYFSGLSSRRQRPGPALDLPCLLGVTLAEWLRLQRPLIRQKQLTLVAEGTTATGDRLLRRHLGFAAASNDGMKLLRRRYWLETNDRSIISYLQRSRFFGRCRELGQRL